MTDSARARATLALHEILSHPYGTEVRRAAVAAIVNEIISACVEEANAKAAEEAIEQLALSVQTIADTSNDVIAGMVEAVRCLARGEYAECEARLNAVEARRDG